MITRCLLFALPFVIMGWLGILMLVGALTNETPAHVVLFPSDDVLNNLPEDVKIMDANSWSVTVTTGSGNLPRTLYANGAYLVLPAGLSGCFSALKELGKISIS